MNKNYTSISFIEEGSYFQSTEVPCRQEYKHLLEPGVPAGFSVSPVNPQFMYSANLSIPDITLHHTTESEFYSKLIFLLFSYVFTTSTNVNTSYTPQ
jgi:hypothetical protein